MTTKENLLNTIEYSTDTDLKSHAWEQLLKQNPSNYDLRYIIEYTDLKSQAAEQLLKQNPDNEDLRYIIEYTDLKSHAAEQLLKQNPDNEDLRYIIRYTDLKSQAAEQLLKLCKIEKIDEEALIKEIAGIVVKEPSKLKMDNWHCGTSHCLAGWAVTLRPDLQKVENKFDTETAGCVALPNYAHLFFQSNETVLNVLKNILS